MLEFTRTEQHRARRDYVCHLCGKTIRAGAEYIYEVSKYDGRLNDYRRHIHCDALLNAWAYKTGADEYEDSEIGTYLHDVVCSSCGLRGSGECAEETVFSCDTALVTLLRPTVLAAAMKSVRENEEGGA